MGSGVAQVLLQRPDVRGATVRVQLLVERADHRGQVRGRDLVVHAGHPEHLVPDERALQRAEQVHPLAQLVGVVGHVRAVEVPAWQVLRPHRRAVRGPPPERGCLQHGRHATPHDRVVHAEHEQQLRHLRDVSEHVWQVADVHRPAQLAGTTKAQLV